MYVVVVETKSTCVLYGDEAGDLFLDYDIAREVADHHINCADGDVQAHVVRVYAITDLKGTKLPFVKLTKTPKQPEKENE